MAMTTSKQKREDYIEKYEKNLILFGLFAFIIFGVMSLTFLLPRVYDFYGGIYPKKDKEAALNNLNLNKNSPEINYRSGRESFKQNNYSLALSYFKKAVESEPNNIDYLTELAVTNYRLRNYNEAIKVYDRIISLDPSNTFACNSIGNVYWIKKDFKRAEFYFRKAIELNPNLVVSYNNLALMLDENGKKEEAIEVLNQGIEINSNNAELKMTLRIIENKL
jgi:tetratricopeptide (TPR) repeat protein